MAALILQTKHLVVSGKNQILVITQLGQKIALTVLNL